MSTHILEYTEIPYAGLKREEFNSRELAESWVKENKATIYWSNLYLKNAKSLGLKPPVPSSVDLSKYKKIEGHLTTYFETGMECTGLILEDDSIIGPPNPDFKSDEPESERNFKFYKDHSAINFFKTGDVLEVEGVGLVLLVKDRAFATQDGWRLSFYPQGFSRTEWVELFIKQKKAKLYKRQS